MHHPMRAIRDNRYRLIHNLLHQTLTPFHIDQNFYFSLTWQNILNNIYNDEDKKWFLKDISDYYFRS